MEEILELFKGILGPVTLGLAIIGIINWFKMFPGAQNPDLAPLWPGIAGILGSALLSLYAWILFGITNIKDVTIVIVVGFFLGLSVAGLYKLADKINR